MVIMVIENYLILFAIFSAIFSIIFLFLSGKHWVGLYPDNKKRILLAINVFLVLYGLLDLKLVSQSLFFSFSSNVILFILSFLFILFFYMPEKGKYVNYLVYLSGSTLLYLAVLTLLFLFSKDKNVGLWVANIVYTFSLASVGYFFLKNKDLPIILKLSVSILFITFFILSTLELLSGSILGFKFNCRILFSGIIVLIGDIYLLFYKRFFPHDVKQEEIEIPLMGADSLKKAILEAVGEFRERLQSFYREILKLSSEGESLLKEYNESLFKVSYLNKNFDYNEADLRAKIESTVSFLLEENNKSFTTLGDLTEKGKIISSGVVNLDSVIDSAKKNLDGIMTLIERFKEEKDFMFNKNRELEKISEYVHALSMNASIESSSKKNLTSDFSVVASDLRSLSDLIKTQSSQIDDILVSLSKDFNSGISSTLKVKEFFVEMEKINEKIFSAVLNIVNYSNSIYSEAETINQKSIFIKDISENISNGYNRIDSDIKTIFDYFSSIEQKLDNAKRLFGLIIENFNRIIREIPDSFLDLQS